MDTMCEIPCALYNIKYRTEDLREWGDLIRSCVVKKKDEFGQVRLIQDINCHGLVFLILKDK